MRRTGLLFVLLALTLSALTGCGSLGLNSDTDRIDGNRYLLFRPWLHYEVAGSGQPLVLLHDSLTDSHTWRHNVKELSGFFQVFTLDLPGFGRSANPYQNNTLDYYSSAVGLFLREMNLKGAVVAGHGMGGAVALDAYVRFPTLVKSVVVINAVGFDEPTEVLAQDLDRMGVALHNSFTGAPDMERIQKDVLEGSLGHLYADKKQLTPELVRYYLAHLEKAAGRRNLLSHLRQFSTEGLMRRLVASEAELLAQPKMERRGERTVVVLWGTEDPWYPPRTSEYFRARVPRAKVAIIRDAGHFPQEERPEVVNGLLLDALLPRPVPGNEHTMSKYDASMLLEEGRVLKRRKQFPEAMAKFKAATELNPYLGVAYYEIGDILFAEHKYAEAIEMLGESLRIFPHNAQVHYRLATTYHNQATTMERKWRAEGLDADFIEDSTAPMLARGVRHYEDAGRLDPNLRNTWFNLGRIYEQAGDYAEVARVYGRLAVADPNDLRAANLYINALLKADDKPGAVEAIAAVARIKSERRRASWPAWRAKLLMELHQWEEAVAAWRMATDLDPGRAAYYGYLALTLMRSGKAEESKEPLSIALRGDADNPLWLSLSGEQALAAKEWDLARDRFQRVLKAEPESADAGVGLATALVRTDAIDEAAGQLDPLLLKVPDHPGLMVARARVHCAESTVLAKARKRKEAQGHVKQALDLLTRAHAGGFDIGPLAADADFGCVKRRREFRALRRKAH